MNWTDLVKNPKAISHLYSQVPPLRSMEAVMIRIDRDGPTFSIDLDFPQYADHVPTRWHPDWNTVAIQLDFSGLRDLSIKGASTNPVLNFSIEKLGDELKITANDADIRIEFVCDSIYIQKVTGYMNTERSSTAIS